MVTVLLMNEPNLSTPAVGKGRENPGVQSIASKAAQLRPNASAVPWGLPVDRPAISERNTIP